MAKTPADVTDVWVVIEHTATSYPKFALTRMRQLVGVAVDFEAAKKLVLKHWQNEGIFQERSQGRWIGKGDRRQYRVIIRNSGAAFCYVCEKVAIKGNKLE